MAFISDVTALSGTTPSISFTGGDVYTVTLSSGITPSFTNPPPAGQSATVTIFITQSGSNVYGVTWPATIKWSSGLEHQMTPVLNTTDIVSFTTVDGGATYYGFIGGQAMETA